MTLAQTKFILSDCLKVKKMANKILNDKEVSELVEVECSDTEFNISDGETDEDSDHNTVNSYHSDKVSEVKLKVK